MTLLIFLYWLQNTCRIYQISNVLKTCVFNQINARNIKGLENQKALDFQVSHNPDQGLALRADAWSECTFYHDETFYIYVIEELRSRGVTAGLRKEGPGAGRPYPQGLDDQVSGLQLPLHHAEKHSELRFTEGVHVKLFFL